MGCAPGRAAAVCRRSECSEGVVPQNRSPKAPPTRPDHIPPPDRAPENAPAMSLKPLTDALADYFNTPATASAYGIEATGLSSDGRVIHLTVTLRSGRRYCCSGPGCHLGLLEERDFDRLR